MEYHPKNADNTFLIINVICYFEDLDIHIFKSLNSTGLPSLLLPVTYPENKPLNSSSLQFINWLNEWHSTIKAVKYEKLFPLLNFYRTI